MTEIVYRATPRQIMEIPLGNDPIFIDALCSEIAAVPLESVPDGSGTARGADTEDGWISGLSMARIQRANYRKYPCMFQAIAALGWNIDKDAQQIMVNRLEPFSGLKAHRDAKPDHWRFHLPIFTNDQVVWWDEWSGSIEMLPMVWYGPVNYCGWLHSMANKGESARTHLVVDFA